MTIEEIHYSIDMECGGFAWKRVVLDLLNALIPPETLKECEAIVGTPDFDYFKHGYYFSIDCFADAPPEKRLAKAKQAVIAKRVAEWMEAQK